MLSIEKVITPIETEKVSYVDHAFDGTLVAEIDDGVVRVNVETIDGAQTHRIPLVHLEPICTLLHAIHTDPGLVIPDPPDPEL